MAEGKIFAKGMVGVAQLVERRVVASVVVGSSPITHPILKFKRLWSSDCSLFLPTDSCTKSLCNFSEDP
jgi:hypothetical protein